MGPMEKNYWKNYKLFLEFWHDSLAMWRGHEPLQMASEHDWTGWVLEEGGEDGRDGGVVQEEANQAARRAGGGANLQAIFC